MASNRVEHVREQTFSRDHFDAKHSVFWVARRRTSETYRPDLDSTNAVTRQTLRSRATSSAEAGTDCFSPETTYYVNGGQPLVLDEPTVPPRAGAIIDFVLSQTSRPNNPLNDLEFPADAVTSKNECQPNVAHSEVSAVAPTGAMKPSPRLVVVAARSPSGRGCVRLRPGRCSRPPLSWAQRCPWRL